MRGSQQTEIKQGSPFMRFICKVGLLPEEMLIYWFCFLLSTYQVEWSTISFSQEEFTNWLHREGRQGILINTSSERQHLKAEEIMQVVTVARWRLGRGQILQEWIVIVLFCTFRSQKPFPSGLMSSTCSVHSGRGKVPPRQEIRALEF